MSTDVVIIGGGVMGCGIGLRLAQRGARVTVLERSIPGAEASSAAAGMLAAQMEAHEQGPFLELCLESRRLYPAFAEELRDLSGVDIAYRPSGLLNTAFDDAQLKSLRKTVAWQQSIGLDARLLDGGEARQLEPALSSKVLAAAYFPGDHQVDSRLLVRALSMAAARAGVQFRTGYVRSVVIEKDRAVGVDLEGERVPASAVVIAAGAWSGLVQGVELGTQTVRPAKGQMLQLQTRLPLFERILFSDQGYLVPRTDGRVIAGSTMERVGYGKQVTASGLSRILAMALRLCPALEDAEVGEFWAGLRPDTEDHLPLLGRGPAEGLFLATGHFRNGILLTPITARLIAQLVMGDAPTLSLEPFGYSRLRKA